MSYELVPLSYDRAAFNTLHGTDLAEHNDLLTAEQAEAINETYDIELCFGAHGLRLSKDPDAVAYANRKSYVREEEYEAAASLVADMRPGKDVLFVEGYGFSKPAFSDEEKLDATGDTSIQKLSRELSMGQEKGALLNGEREQERRERLANMRNELEQARHDRTINAWEYASILSYLRGVEVVWADLDAFDESRVDAAVGGKALSVTVLTHNPNAPWIPNINRRRVRSGRNILRDYALDHLPLYRAPLANEPKSKLRYLNGEAHQDRSIESFHDIGLDVKVKALSMTAAAHEIGKMPSLFQPLLQ